MDAGTDPFGVGSEVMLGAEHMEGMNGATATIDAAENDPQSHRRINRILSLGSDQNHKW